MKRADVKLGFSCNNRCVFCVQGDKRDRFDDRSFDEIRDILTDERRRCDSLVLTGGEVTVRKDLAEIVAVAKALEFKVIQLQTNGRALASMRYLRSLVDAGITEVSPAIHGADAATHDSQTRAPGSFRQTLKGMINARRLGLPVIVNCVITRANQDQLPSMAELLVRVGVTQFQLAFVHALGTAGDNFSAVVPRMADVMPFVWRALDIGRNAGVRCMTEAIPLCVLGDYREYAAEWIIPSTRIIDAQLIIDDYTITRRAEGKIKGPRCADCAWDEQCEGPWREYPEHFGWDEFVPVVD